MTRLLKKLKLFILTPIALGLILIGCSSGQYPGYEYSDNGLYYKIVEDSDTELIKKGDFLKVNIRYSTMSDSVFFDSKKEVLPVWIKIDEPAFRGDVMEGISMLSIGDSASFIVRIDTFFLMTIGAARVPDFGNDSMMYVNIRVLDSKSSEEFELEREILDQQTKVQLEELRVKEIEDLKNYIQINNITQQPTESGLVFIPVQNGTGALIKKGQTVICHYTGAFIDGQIFDTSKDMEPLRVKIGSGDMIAGFDEALQMMNKGAKAKVIIPSEIGFGKSEMNSPIPPYATLVFDIEVIDVMD